ncbi:hypothetical protein [Phaeobacter gallaeciensis]|uniref:hypothetical protein n=1 Tax=Phaeobacter gallaeciensis TaxID=60890 RepID=UPI000BBC90AC|nr:hypothetical protein [Phaeobacter gallaeciensis]ATF18098.1 hypothetical protein PhaeoP129_01461 [Phaeobacter gallaeciensis]ATF22207.1 hypothetical protein PhaeoP128_01461 [Phaeobacter gallaeciensis]
MPKVADLLLPIARRFGLLAGLALGSGLATPAMALDGMYTCAVTSLSGRGWIPPQISLHFHDEWTAEVVHSGNVSALSGRPLKAGFFRISDVSYRVSWTVVSASVGNGAEAVKTHYRAVFNTQNKKLSVQVISLDSGAKPPRGIGQCVQVTS